MITRRRPFVAPRKNDPVDSEEQHPVAAGLVALITVGLVVGLLIGLVTLVATRVVGVGGGSGSAQAVDDGASLYLPTPSPTERTAGPSVTFAPGEAVGGEFVEPVEPPRSSQAAAGTISLQTSSPRVAPMERINLTGVYPGGEGAILQVQRKEGGAWADFASVDVAVQDETFATYVMTGRPGQQHFRVRDTDTGKVSNEVVVTVG